MERNRHPDLNGLIEKRISWERYLGNESEIALEAYRIYLERTAKLLPGDSESDWATAEKTVRKRFSRELSGKPAPKLAKDYKF